MTSAVCFSGFVRLEPTILFSQRTCDLNKSFTFVPERACVETYSIDWTPIGPFSFAVIDNRIFKISQTEKRECLGGPEEIGVVQESGLHFHATPTSSNVELSLAPDWRFPTLYLYEHCRRSVDKQIAVIFSLSFAHIAKENALQTVMTADGVRLEELLSPIPDEDGFFHTTVVVKEKLKTKEWRFTHPSDKTTATLAIVMGGGWLERFLLKSNPAESPSFLFRIVLYKNL